MGALVIDAHTVAVGEQHYPQKKILIATGGWPYILTFRADPNLRISQTSGHRGRWLHRSGVRRHFHGLGAHTTQLYRGSLFLRGFDEEIAHAARELLTAGRPALRTQRRIDQPEAAGLKVLLTDGSERRLMRYYATAANPIWPDWA
jgi:glutathione reductase (NADPH)